MKRKRLISLAAVFVYLLGTIAAPLGSVAAAGTPNGATLNTHPVMVDETNKLVSWVPDQDKAYDHAMWLSMDYLLHKVPTAEGGKPAYYTHSYMNPDTQQPAGWPHNPAGLNAMLIESALGYYAYSGNGEAIQMAKDVADHHLANGMTLPSDNWANVPYASGDSGSLTYKGASYGNSTGVGDGVGVIQPDKVGEFGHSLYELYKQTGDTKYRDAAVNAANALASHVRTGNATQSPWPFRVYAANNNVREQYSAHVIAPIRLLDTLIEAGVGNVASYQTARTTAWNWMMAYPMQNNVWANYFEDVAVESGLNNTTQLNALMAARYLLEHPEMDANWEAKVRGIIAWVEQQFGVDQYGTKSIREQKVFFHAMGSHTARYASVNALLYEKTGDATAKEKAYRSFNWATYMARSNGVVIDGPTVGNQWFTDGYGDYIRHFVVGLGAVPEWAPNGQNHIVRSTSVVQQVAYGANQIDYRTHGSGTEVIRVDRQPSSVLVGGQPLAQKTSPSSEGWSYNATNSTVTVTRSGGNIVAVVLGGAPSNQAPSVSITSPANNASFTPPASFNVTANASDADGAVEKVEFYQNGSLVATDTEAPYAHNVQNLGDGNYTYTAKAYDNNQTSATSTAVSVKVNSVAQTGWTSSDIGPVGVAGSSTLANGIYTVKGSGVDIWDNADSFHFMHQPLSGDGEIKARLTSQQNTDQWAIAGVMIRESLDAGSRHAVAGLTPGNGFTLTSRSSTNGSSGYTAGGAGTAPQWVRLVRAGNTITASKSANGTSWTTIGSVQLAMGQQVYAGLAVTSHVNSTLGTATFDNVAVSGGTTNPPADTTAPTISNVSAADINQNGATVSWTTNEPSTSQVEYGKTTAYGDSTSVNTNLETAHAQVVAGLDAGSTYHYRVKSTDAAGNTATSGNFTFVTPAEPDTQAPSTPSNVQAVANSATQATVSWQAATDNASVSKYLVLRDGVQVGETTNLSFVNLNLNPGQTYLYTVIAVDAAGNQSGSSVAAVVTMPQPPAPDTTKPVVALTNPANNATVNGNVQLSGTASDNSGVTSVEFSVDGVRIGSVLTAAPYQVAWNSTSVANGVHTVQMTARDAAGNSDTTTATVNVQNQASTGLVAAYSFNETSGTVLTNRAGVSSLNGAVSGATWNTGGKYGGALSFDGTNDSVVIPDANVLDATSALTIEAWVKPSSISGWRTIMMKEASGGMAYGLYAADSTNKPPAFYGHVNSDVAAKGTANLSTTAWTHVTGTFDGSNLRLYINGNLVRTQVLSGNLRTTTNPLRLGGNSAWGEYFRGLMDDVRIYNRVLPQAEIQADMNKAL